MDKNEERVRNTTLVQLWNDEIIDRERIDTGEMSEADRARQMEAMAKHLQRTATERHR
jgi:hypothetical protein